jgi:hypothetical protein
VHKALEAEERLNFMADVSVLFGGDKSKSHLDSLIRQARLADKKKPELQAAEGGKFAPGKSYIVE